MKTIAEMWARAERMCLRPGTSPETRQDAKLVFYVGFIDSWRIAAGDAPETELLAIIKEMEDFLATVCEETTHRTGVAS